MKRLIALFILAILATGCNSLNGIEYSIDKWKIEEYRKSSIAEGQLAQIIDGNSDFIHLTGNQAVSDATLEHHVIDEIKTNGCKTFLVFEYFSLEGVTCNIKAVTIGPENTLKSIVRLADYREYPDGALNESTLVQKHVATRTTIVDRLKSYNDSLDHFVMKRDSTIVTFKLKSFERIELIDSIAKHHEYIK